MDNQNGNIRSNVRLDREWGEYVVRVTIGGVPLRGQDGTVEACEYRTDDHADAINTAARMVEEQVQRNTATVTAFECDECEHEWTGTANPKGNGHAWETCPNCGADDGENCWDCGESMEDEAGEMCTACHRTLCWECTGGRLRSYYSPHLEGRLEDKGRCGETARIT